jgi:hypothetical protein
MGKLLKFVGICTALYIAKHLVHYALDAGSVPPPLPYLNLVGFGVTEEGPTVSREHIIAEPVAVVAILPQYPLVAIACIFDCREHDAARIAPPLPLLDARWFVERRAHWPSTFVISQVVHFRDDRAVFSCSCSALLSPTPKHAPTEPWHCVTTDSAKTAKSTAHAVNHTFDSLITNSSASLYRLVSALPSRLALGRQSEADAAYTNPSTRRDT